MFFPRLAWSSGTILRFVTSMGFRIALKRIFHQLPRIHGIIVEGDEKGMVMGIEVWDAEKRNRCGDVITYQHTLGYRAVFLVF
ncbi:hypothetical protein HRbin01_01748 [archaeon HR01]|nr:hypothetical protein HRbin01_01748 [archaeon HR01]